MAEKACDRDRQAPEPKLPAIILPAYNFFFRGGYHSSFSIFEDAVHLLLHMFRRGNGNGEWKGQAVGTLSVQRPFRLLVMSIALNAAPAFVNDIIIQ